MTTIGTLYQAHFEAVNTTFANAAGDGLATYNKTMRTLAGIFIASHNFEGQARPLTCIKQVMEVASILSVVHTSVHPYQTLTASPCAVYAT